MVKNILSIFMLSIIFTSCVPSDSGDGIGIVGPILNNENFTVSAGTNYTNSPVKTITPSVSNVTDPTYFWEFVSGPGTLTYDDDSLYSPQVTLTNGATGTYNVKLTVTSGSGQVGSGTGTVIYDTGNPIISAGTTGNSYSTTFTQTGTATDAVSPIKTIQWTKIGGSGAVIFGSANSLSTTVSATSAGSYTVLFTVTDEAGNTANDSFTFTWL